MQLKLYKMKLPLNIHVRSKEQHFETCLIPENAELEGKVFSLAPGEGQKPLVILADPKFEKMCNPGKGGYLTKRPHPITPCKYFNQRILDVDGQFAKDIEYLFVAQYTVEAKQIRDDASNFILSQRHGIQGTGQRMNAEIAKNADHLHKLIQKDHAFKFLKHVRGSLAYFQQTFYDLLAMIRQLDIPTWFLTLSAADMKWPDSMYCISIWSNIN